MPLLRDRVAALEQEISNLQAQLRASGGDAKKEAPKEKNERDYTYSRRRAAV